MIEFDSSSGDILIDGESFPRQTQENMNGHFVGENIYSSLNKKTVNTENKPCDITAYYKNGRLTRVTVSLDSEFIRQTYTAPADLDFRDYMTPYIDFCKRETEKLRKSIIETSKNTFAWGKLQVVTDPRDHYTFIEIKYGT